MYHSQVFVITNILQTIELNKYNPDYLLKQ